MADWPSLQSIKLVQRVLVRHKRDEMENIIIFACSLGLFVHYKWVLPREAIVCNTNHFRVTDSVAFLFTGETGTELAQVGEFGSQLDLRSIHQNRQDGLCRARIVDHLVGEEELWVVVCQSFRFLGLRHPLEEEYQSVNRLNFVQLFIFKRHEFLDLDASHTNLRDQLSKDSRV